MAQDIEKIIDLLKEIKRADNTNTESFERLLVNIGRKLESMENNVASNELLKAYLSEITKNMEDKYTTTLSKFSEIENALKSIYKEQDEHVKTKSMQELYEVFSKNMNNFYTEAKQQKALITAIEARLSGMNTNKSDKEDILRTITLLRKDFENLNHAYKHTIDDVNTNLKSILKNLINSDNSKLTTSMSAQIEILSKATNDVIGYLKSIDEKNITMEKLLENVATNENLKITQGIIDSIQQKTDRISTFIDKVADKSDIESLQKTALIMNQKIDETAAKEDFSRISLKTESLIIEINEIKKTLARVTQNIENLPDTKYLEESVQALYKKFDNLADDIETTSFKGDLYGFDSKIAILKEELYIIKNIITDLNDVVMSKIISSINDISFKSESNDIKNHITELIVKLPQQEDIERILLEGNDNSHLLNDLIARTDILADKLDALPSHNDMAELSSNQLGLVENLQFVANKDDVENILGKADEIEAMIDNLNFDKEFENIYDKASTIEDWLKDSNIKEHSVNISEQLPRKAEQKDLLEILEVTKKITGAIEELSQNTDVKKVNHTVSDVYTMLDELKVDLMNSQEMHNDTLLIQLQELQKALSGIVSGDEFNNFIDDLKHFSNNILESFAKISDQNQQNLTLQQKVIDKINTLDIDEKIDSSFNKLDNVNTQLTNISTFIDNKMDINNEDIRKNISDIREIIENKKSNFMDLEQIISSTILKVEKYLSDIKTTILKNSSGESAESLNSKLVAVEKELVEYKQNNENQFAKLIDKLDAYEQLSENITLPIESLSVSISELTELKEQVQQLTDSFKADGENPIPAFVADKFSELESDLQTLADNVENGLEKGFAYSAELVEEKTSVLLDLIKELRHKSTDNIDLYEKLTVTDNKLIDLKQELELINTDVINNLNSKTEEMLKGLEPIRDMLESLSNSTPNNSSCENIKEQLETLMEAIRTDFYDTSQYSKDTLEKLENTYNRLSENIIASENNLKDFILGDIDSVIFKVDDMKSYLEESMNRIIPPDVSGMEEFHNFVAEITQFKEEQKAYLSDAVEEIKTSIEQRLDFHQDELKSLIAVATNNEEIIQAIEDLKYAFRTRVADISFLEETDAFDEFNSSNHYEQAFEVSQNEEFIQNIKGDFEKFAELLKGLTGKNSEIEQVLNTIRTKLDTITVMKSEISEEDLAKGLEEEDVIIGENNFDFIKAFDLLKDDISNLRTVIEDTLLIDVSQNKNIIKDSDNFDNKLLEELNYKLDDLTYTLNKDWLEDIKNYLGGNDIQTILEDINDKINLLTLTDNSDLINELKESIQNISLLSSIDTESGNEICSMLKLISEKIDILASDIDYELIEDVKETLEKAYETKTEHDEEIKAMLSTLDQKVDIIASSDNIDFISDVRETLEQAYETKAEQNAEIKDMLSTLDQKIDLLSSTDSADLILDVKETLEKAYETKTEQNAEIKDMLSTLGQKVDIIATSDSSDLILDVKETLEKAYETKTEQNTEIKDILSTLEQKIDIIASSDNFDLISDVKDILEKIYENSNANNSDNTVDIQHMLQSLDQKVDIIADTDNFELVSEVRETIENLYKQHQPLEQTLEITRMLDVLSDKVDILASNDSYDLLSEVKDTVEKVYEESRENKISKDQAEIKNLLTILDQKIDIIASTDTSEGVNELKDAIVDIDEKIDNFSLKPVEESVQKLSESDAKITNMLEALNHRIDIMTEQEHSDAKRGLEDVKHLILAQMKYIEKLDKNGKTEAFKKCLNELTLEVNNLNLNSNINRKDINRSLKDMKESIMSAVVTIFEQVSFVEESEDIKDFVEEKTDVINQNLEAVTRQLRQITNSTDDEYTYSMQDIESDLAKLRMALNELQNNELGNQSNELANISGNIYRITSKVDELQNYLTQDEIKDIRDEVSVLREQTDKILISSGESYNALNNGLEDFSKIITNYLANKVDRITQLLERSSTSDKVMRQALIYMGEWIDSTSESMNKISTNSDEIIDIKSAIESLKLTIPEQKDILNSIEEKFDEQQERLSFFEKHITKLGALEEKFEQQQERIDRLEMTIEKVLSAVEDIDDSKITRKIDKIDKQIAKLSINIEKLASYVD
ncbi:hypothetical protein HDR58_08225 [bacterium]|nr:hypothetical protein [bacterium]